MLNESEKLTELILESGVEDKELDDVVSEFHKASQEANMVIKEEESARLLVTWKEAWKTFRQQDWTGISVHVQHLHAPRIWNSSRKEEDVSGASVWDISVEIALTKLTTILRPELMHLCSSLTVTVALQSQHNTWDAVQQEI